jgi:hypothetical protein
MGKRKNVSRKVTKTRRRDKECHYESCEKREKGAGILNGLRRWEEENILATESTKNTEKRPRIYPGQDSSFSVFSVIFVVKSGCPISILFFHLEIVLLSVGN